MTLLRNKIIDWSLLALAVASLFALYKGCGDTQKSSPTDKVVAIHKKPSVEYEYKGKQHTTNTVNKLTTDQAKLLESETITRLLAEIKGLKAKNLVGATTVTSKAEYVVVPVKTDTTLAYRSKWLDFDADLKANSVRIVKRDSVSLAFIRNNGVLTADLFSADSATKFSGLKSWTVPEKKPRRLFWFIAGAVAGATAVVVVR